MNQCKAAVDWVKANLDGIIEARVLNDQKLLYEKLSELIASDSEIRPLVCQSIKHLFEGEYLDNRLTFSIIEKILLHTSSIDTESTNHAIQLLLLLPFHEANASLPIEERLTRDDTGRLAFDALESRLNTIDDTTNLIPYVRLIKFLGYRSALPIVDSIEKNTTDEKLKKEAAETATILRSSIRKRWEDTPPDLTSTLESRCQQIREYLNDGSLNEDEHAQALLNAFKDCPCSSSEDPRCREIEILFEHRSEKIKLAAAFIICQVLKPKEALFKKALHELANLAMFSRSPGISIEASAILDDVEHDHPDASAYIRLEKQNVNLEFVKRFKL